jgi:hypothetical protein
MAAPRDNGWAVAPSRNPLARIPGRYVIEAMDRLPPSGPDAAAQQVDVDVPFWGRFRITFNPLRQTVRGFPARWIWVAASARSLARDTGR